jgi:hypothetical protein
MESFRCGKRKGQRKGVCAGMALWRYDSCVQDGVIPNEYGLGGVQYGCGALGMHVMQVFGAVLKGRYVCSVRDPRPQT